MNGTESLGRSLVEAGIKDVFTNHDCNEPGTKADTTFRYRQYIRNWLDVSGVRNEYGGLSDRNCLRIYCNVEDASYL